MKKYKITIICVVILGLVFGGYFLRDNLPGALEKWQIPITQTQLRFFPDSPALNEKMATLLRQTPEYRLAIDQYRLIVKMTQEGLEVDKDKAIGPKEDVQHLIDLYMRSIKKDAQYVPARMGLASLFFEVGMLPEAFKAYVEILKIDPKFGAAHFQLGALYGALGDVKSAVHAFSQSLEVDLENKEAYLGIIEAYNQLLAVHVDQIEYKIARRETVEAYAELIGRTKNDAESFYYLGVIYGQIDDLPRAISAFQMALDIDPRHRLSLYQLGNAYKRSGLLAEALNSYNRCVKIDPRFSDAYVNIGAIYALQGSKEKAVENYKLAIKANPHNSNAYFNLGFMAEANRDFNQAIEYYGKAVMIDDKAVEAYYNLGNVYTQLKEYDKAQTAYKSALKINPSHLNALVNMSLIAYTTNNMEEAVRYYKEAVLLGYDAPKEFKDAINIYTNK